MNKFLEFLHIGPNLDCKIILSVFSCKLGETFFYLLDYVTHRSEKSNFKKKWVLPNITAKLFVFGIIGNHFDYYYFETSLRFGKLCKNCNNGVLFFFFFFFFAITDLKKFC